MGEDKNRPKDVIAKFNIIGGEGISDYWRRNKSSIETRELANLLRALRKVAGYIGTNIGNIIWSGMKSSSEATDIVLNPALVMGQYPVPGNKTDIAIGTIIQEAYRQIEWSERVKTLIGRKLEKQFLEKYDRKLQWFVDMAENIYVDIVSNRSVLGFYTEKVRRSRYSQARKDFVQPPTFEELVHIWWIMAADRSGRKYLEEFSNAAYGDVYGYNLEQYYKEPLRLLNSIVRELIEECPKITSVVSRCQYRVNLYLRIWDELVEKTKIWITDLRDPMYMPKALDVGDILSDEQLGEALKPIKATLAREIEVFLQQKLDLTDSVRMIANDDSDIVPIEVSEIILPLQEPIDNELVYKLYLSLAKHAKRRKVLNRGLNSGKIDARRLYRAPVTGNIFYHKKEKHEMESDIVLLVDASGSMGGSNWKVMEKIFSSLFMAVDKLNKNTKVFAYNEARGICLLTELAPQKRQLYTVLPKGKTASGEAIIATALMLKKSYKRPFIFHLTDGASNWGCKAKYAIDYCNKKKINLMTLGFGCEKGNKVALREEYGNQVEFVDTIKELPKIIGKLLSHTTYM